MDKFPLFQKCYEDFFHFSNAKPNILFFSGQKKIELV